MALDNLLKLDAIDKQILNIIQKDSTQSIQDIAGQVGLTNNPCWRRIKRLEEDGVIQRRVALIDRTLIGLGTTAFVSLRIDSHNAEWLESFAKCVDQMPEIVECHRMAGDIDYFLKVVIADLNHYDRVYKRLLLAVPGLADVSAAFSMEEIKMHSGIDANSAAID